MSDLRQNPVTGRWVVVAPSRSSRPVDDDRDGSVPHDREDRRARRDPSCPFCPGNEEELPGIHWELAAESEPGWRCRAVPNRYPAFSAAVSHPRALESRTLREGSEGPVRAGRRYPAAGRQEVLIESPRHDRDPVAMSDDELRAVAQLYRERVRAVVTGSPELFPSLFRNQGPGAGASLAHPHAQLVATGASGPRRRIRHERLTDYRSETGECLVCRLPELEPGGEERVIEEDEFLRAYVPWAPERPLEVWLLPKRHRPSFGDAEADEADSVAGMLGRTVRRLRTLVGATDYNYMFHTSSGAGRRDPALHWFLQFRPVTARLAGFELDTGIVINPASPDEDAERLRGAESTIHRGGEA